VDELYPIPWKDVYQGTTDFSYIVLEFSVVIVYVPIAVERIWHGQNCLDLMPLEGSLRTSQPAKYLSSFTPLIS
jgi:hypothetical protein